MFEILRKEYEVKVFESTMKFKQATLRESIEFMYETKQKGFSMIDWVYEFITHNSDTKISEEEFMAKVSVGKLDVSKFMDLIYDKRFTGMFESGKGGKKGKTIPYESYLMTLCEYFKADPNTILNNYTPEAIAYYVEGIIYNNNEKTKEGQNRNKVNQGMKDMRKETSAEDDLKSIKDMQK